MKQLLMAWATIEGKIKYLKGYIPRNTVLYDFMAAAEINNWGYHITEPEKP